MVDQRAKMRLSVVVVVFILLCSLVWRYKPVGGQFFTTLATLIGIFAAIIYSAIQLHR